MDTNQWAGSQRAQRCPGAVGSRGHVSWRRALGLREEEFARTEAALHSMKDSGGTLRGSLEDSTINMVARA